AGDQIDVVQGFVQRNKFALLPRDAEFDLPGAGIPPSIVSRTGALFRRDLLPICDVTLNRWRDFVSAARHLWQHIRAIKPGKSLARKSKDSRHFGARNRVWKATGHGK